MHTITVRLGERSYPILIGEGLFNQSGRLISKLLQPACRVAVVTDRNVGKLYAGSFNRQLVGAGFNPRIITLPGGESTKSSTYLNRLYNEFIAHRLERQSAVIALGGGVIGDIAGLAAATFMRGISFIQLPTSLLAQVDSSVGGKVAINLPQGKNLVGAFHQPELVIIDPLFLKTLPRPEFINGMTEVIKMALIRSTRLVRFLLQNNYKIIKLDNDCLAEMIYQALSIKARIVEADEKETGRRAVLNYGHTIGHVIELAGKYPHGKAIAFGMHYAALIARQMKLLNDRFVQQQDNLLKQYSLPVKLTKKIPAAEIIKRLRFDKKVKGGKVRFVLLKGIGKTVIVNNVTPAIIKKALSDCS